MHTAGAAAICLKKKRKNQIILVYSYLTLLLLHFLAIFFQGVPYVKLSISASVNFYCST